MPCGAAEVHRIAPAVLLGPLFKVAAAELSERPGSESGCAEHDSRRNRNVPDAGQGGDNASGDEPRSSEHG